MSENGEIYTAGKNFTLPLAVTAWTNLVRFPDPLADGSQAGTLSRTNLTSVIAS